MTLIFEINRLTGSVRPEEEEVFTGLALLKRRVQGLLRPRRRK